MADDLMMNPDEEEEEKPEPRIFKPDLYEAAMNNDTQKVFTYLEEKVPPTHVDEQSGWTPLHWAAKHGNVQMTHLLIEFGATAPYHRMVAAAKKAQEKAEADAAAAAKKESGGGFVVPELKEEDGEGGGGGDGKTSEEEKLEGGGAAEGKKTDSVAAGDAGTDANAGGATAADSKTADDKKGDGDAQDKGAADAAAPSGEAGSKEGGAAAAAADSKAAGVVDEKKGDSTGAAAADVEEEDEDDMDYETAMDRKAETSVDLTKNTPLLWAAASGHLRVVWLLLQAGYDPNNLDNLENNSLHLAACGGNAKVCRVLVDSGAMSTLVNTYKNLPIDMALGSEIRDIVSDAMIKGASMTAADIAAKHVTNMGRYTELTSKLEVIIKRAEKPSGKSSEAISETIASLMDAISESKEWGLDLASIEKGEMLVKKLEMGQVLSSEVKVVEEHAPIRSQAQYKEFVSRLEGAIVDARTLGLDEEQISACEAVVRRAGLEFWVCVLTNRLESVECATDTHEHDLRRLEQAITKGLDAGAADEVVDKAQELCTRLNAELGMSRALLKVPTYRMPLKEGAEYPEGYWLPEDTGHIDETTENFPHAPPETNEYVWHPAQAYSQLQEAIAAIKNSYSGAEEAGANAEVVAQAKAALVKSEKDIKALHTKNEKDKAHAIEVTVKSIKKKGKGKKK